MIKSSSEKVTLNIEGMSCNNCAAGIKKHLEKNSINDVNVNFSLAEVTFSNNKNYTIQSVIKLIESIGYKVKKQNFEEKKFLKIGVLFTISLIFTLPLLLHMFLDHSSFLYNPFVQFLLCLPVYTLSLIHI